MPDNTSPEAVTSTPFQQGLDALAAYLDTQPNVVPSEVGPLVPVTEWAREVRRSIDARTERSTRTLNDRNDRKVRGALGL